LAHGLSYGLTLGLLCSGCYGYVPAEPGRVTPGEDVRVQLTSLETLPGLASVGREPGESVAGRLVRGDGRELVLRVPVAVQSGAILTRTLGQDVTIPAGRIAQLERRELNRARTGLAFAGGVGALAAILLSFGQGVPDPELPPRREPEEFRGGWGISLPSIGIR
jgi:hypothetical protein